MTPTQRTVWADRIDATTCKRAVPVVHDHGALVYVTEGSMAFEQGQRYDVSAGDVVLVPAGRAHRRLATTTARMWGVGFCVPCYATTELAPLLDPFERTRAGGSAIVTIPADRQAHLARLCEELSRESRGDHALAQTSLLALVLTEVARATTTTPATRPSVVADALRFIERNCLRAMSLADVAAEVGLSASYVATTIKRATGKTVGDWITAGRLAEARNRLRNGDERVAQIAERVGYADVGHFIRMFRRAHGVTPAAFRTSRSSARD
jgi:AraC family transcriptional regulator, transcriptional activator of pobA